MYFLHLHLHVLLMNAVSEQVSLEDIYENFALVSDSSPNRIIRSDRFLAVMLLAFSDVC